MAEHVDLILRNISNHTNHTRATTMGFFFTQGGCLTLMMFPGGKVSVGSPTDLHMGGILFCVS